MTKREAKRMAYRFACIAAEDAADSWELSNEHLSDEDDERVRDALREIAQSLYNRGAKP